MNIATIITMIENHGITFVITAGFLYFIFRGGNVVMMWLENKLVGSHSQKLKEHWAPTIDTSTNIHNILCKAMYEVEANKASVYQYHNGGYSISGISFLKASNTYEFINGKLPSTQLAMQQMPNALYAWHNKHVRENTIDLTVTDTIDNQSTQQMLSQNGVKALIVVGLYDTNGYPIGFLSLEYGDAPTFSLSEEQKQKLQTYATQVAGLIS